jgi:hypothetical protein
MGGFGNVLGAAAGGFSQAHQLDLQRQFENEQNMRGQALGYLSKVALDETALPGARNAATQAILGITQVPMGKFNQKEAGKWLGSVLQPPTPPQTVAQFQAGAAPGLNLSPMPTPPVPIGATGPVPLFGGQPRPAGGQSPVVGALPAGAPQQAPVNLPPIPQPPVSLMSAAQPGGVFMTPEQRIQYTGGLAGAQTGGALGGQLAVLGPAIDKLFSEHPEYLNDPMMGPLLEMAKIGQKAPFSFYGQMNRNVGTGGGTVKDLLAMGYDIPENLRNNPDQWLDVRLRAGLPPTFVPGKGPGQVLGPSGGLISQNEANQMRQQTAFDFYTKRLAAQMPYYEQKLGMQFSKQYQLQNHAYELSVQRGDFADMDKQFYQTYGDYYNRSQALQVMQQNYADATKPGPPNQQAMVSMLMQHIGMTAGAVKGARVGRAQMEEAMESTPWLQGKVAKWFHQDSDGNYIFDGYKGGVTLTKPQMEQMVDLASTRVAAVHDQLNRMQAMGPGRGEFTSPGITSIGGTQPTATQPTMRTKQPPTPPGTPKTAADFLKKHGIE